MKTAILPPLWAFTLCFLVSSADNICKQLRARSGPTKRRAWSGSNRFDTQMVFLKEFFKNKWFWKKSADDKKACKITPRGQRVADLHLFLQGTRELGTYRIYMHEVTLKACMRSYLVGLRSMVLYGTFSTFILCICEKRRLWQDCTNAYARMPHRFSPRLSCAAQLVFVAWIPYFVYAKSEGSGRTPRMLRLVWAIADRRWRSFVLTFASWKPTSVRSRHFNV